MVIVRSNSGCDASSGADGAAASFSHIFRLARITARIFAPMIGSYFLAVNIAGLSGVLMTVAGMASSEAVLLNSLLAFPLMVFFLVWGYAQKRLTILVGVFVIAPILLFAASSWSTKLLSSPSGAQ